VAGGGVTMLTRCFGCKPFIAGSGGLTYIPDRIF
jgi:hypothetical protein